MRNPFPPRALARSRKVPLLKRRRLQIRDVSRIIHLNFARRNIASGTEKPPAAATAAAQLDNRSIDLLDKLVRRRRRRLVRCTGTAFPAGKFREPTVRFHLLTTVRHVILRHVLVAHPAAKDSIALSMPRVHVFCNDVHTSFGQRQC